MACSVLLSVSLFLSVNIGLFSKYNLPPLLNLEHYPFNHATAREFCKYGVLHVFYHHHWLVMAILFTLANGCRSC